MASTHTMSDEVALGHIFGSLLGWQLRTSNGRRMVTHLSHFCLEKRGLLRSLDSCRLKQGEALMTDRVIQLWHGRDGSSTQH
jgi:hypothetical protein